ncbi:universal stress protein [Pseudolysinimonas sp.]|uniref:universal stress protein n=1 Tax=Pseudolysinimonas sp. TaxID=2680009 RepID=UPI003F7EA616
MTNNSRKPIVVGVDGSEPSIVALRHARTLADALHRPVRVLIAWHLPVFAGAGAVSYAWSPVEDAQRVVDSAVVDVWGSIRPADVTTEVVENGAAPALIEASDDAFMVVTGSRGHGGFAGLLLGSVSAAVAEHARCPVLVVPGGRA